MIKITNNQHPIIPIGVHIIFIAIANYVLLTPLMAAIFPQDVFNLWMYVVVVTAIIGCILAVLFPTINIIFQQKPNSGGI